MLRRREWVRTGKQRERCRRFRNGNSSSNFRPWGKAEAVSPRGAALQFAAFRFWLRRQSVLPAIEGQRRGTHPAARRRQVRAGTRAWWGGGWVVSHRIPDRSSPAAPQGGRWLPRRAADSHVSRRQGRCWSPPPPPPPPDQTLRAAHPGRATSPQHAPAGTEGRVPRKAAAPAARSGSRYWVPLCEQEGICGRPAPPWGHWACAVLQLWCGALQVFAAAPSGGGRWGPPGRTRRPGAPRLLGDLLGLRAAWRCVV